MLYCCIAVLLYCCIAEFLYCCIAELLNCCIGVFLNCYIALLLYFWIAVFLNCRISVLSAGQLIPLQCRLLSWILTLSWTLTLPGTAQHSAELHIFVLPLLHCNVLYYPALSCTALYWSVLPCTAIYWSVLPFAALYCPVLHSWCEIWSRSSQTRRSSSSLILHQFKLLSRNLRNCPIQDCVASLHYMHYTTLHCTTLHHTTLHYTAPHFKSLHYTALHCIVLHCTLAHCTTMTCSALNSTSYDLWEIPLLCMCFGICHDAHTLHVSSILLDQNLWKHIASISMNHYWIRTLV